MSAWRRRALATFPSLRQEVARRGSTPYDLFRELRGLRRRAHEARDDETLRRVYALAEWC